MSFDASFFRCRFSPVLWEAPKPTFWRPRSRFGTILGRPNLENQWFHDVKVTIFTKSTFSIPVAILSRLSSSWGAVGDSRATFSSPAALLGGLGALPGGSWEAPGGSLGTLESLLDTLAGRLGEPGGSKTLPEPILSRFWVNLR